MSLPSRRTTEERLIEIKGDPCVVLRDPEGLFEGEAILPMPLYLVYAFLDGRRDAVEVQSAIASKTGGVQIPVEVLEKMIGELDRYWLLENERTESRRNEILEAFTKSAVRPARFLDAPVADLAGLMDSTFTSRAGAGAAEKGKYDGQVRAIVAPHIDLPRGGWCYSHAYKAIAESEGAGTYLILGVAHRSPPEPYILTNKAYGTAFGPAEIDEEFTEILKKRAGPKAFAHEVIHATEHSIEFQAAYLKYVLRDRAPFKIVPVLCSSIDHPHAPAVEDFIGGLQDAIKESRRSVCIVAGIDLAHLGPHFGDEKPITEETIEWMKKEDAKSLNAITAGDARAFWSSVMHDENRRRVCGLAAMYTTLRLLDGRHGELLQYGYAPDPGGGIVSFASAVFR